MSRARGSRLALFGGSFDPVHRGHLHVARSALEHFGFDEIRFLPSPQPPHKTDQLLLPVEDRLELLSLALADEPRFVIDEYEIEQGGSSYTFDTLQAMRARHPGAELFFLIGSDSLRDLPKWYRAPELVESFTLVTVPRDEDHDIEALLAPAAEAFSADAVARLRAHVLPVPALPISSTEVRNTLAADPNAKELDDWLPPAVRRRIAERGHYGAERSGEDAADAARGNRDSSTRSP